ncbi:jg8232 [Pararge aegeria aegeria]|uniref:Jg8232 protein n=1 Tax=Pararge aegeria aegeria TaxID=348720 RepID=A0A8S4QVC0_9NEOP|nr:jg8232 [Pararge aegeria aegeria]
MYLRSNTGVTYPRGGCGGRPIASRLPPAGAPTPPSRFIKSGAADAADASRSLREFKLEAARTSCTRD